VVATIGVGSYPIGLTLSPDGRTLYVANAYDNAVVLINTNTKTIYKTIPVGLYPREMELSPDGSKLYASLIVDIRRYARSPCRQAMSPTGTCLRTYRWALLTIHRSCVPRRLHRLTSR
jgi:YVTN family beta-propeller protein